MRPRSSFTSSQRSRFFAVVLAAFALLVTAPAVRCLETSQDSGAPAEKDPYLKKMQIRYKGVSTLTTLFTQKQQNLALGTTKVSSGRIYIKRPNRFRWETLEPERTILVGNGRKVWFYTAPFREGEHGQVLVKRAADVQSKLALDLLSGQSPPEKNFKIKVLGTRKYDLTPLKAAGDVAHIELELEKSTELVYKLTLYTKTGNQTELALEKTSLGPKLPDSMFDFEPPENTEEIR